ncbi:MAG: GNAT family N-acetyltransferase [bacterium]|nr:GNAT family N-acetyltransferase [bacterium]
MQELKKEEMYKIESIYAGWQESLLWSCMQGHMGRAWVDDIENPTAAEIWLGDFSYFAGDEQSAGAKELVRNIPEDYQSECALMVPQNEAWAKVMEQVYPGNSTRLTRYAMKKHSVHFEPEKLREYISRLPEGYTIRQIDEELYDKAVSERYSRDFCSQFRDCEDYLKRGLGFMVLYGDEPVGGASSYSIFTDGIEIELVTKEEHRRKGVALAAAARLILECLDRNLLPCWDAANLQSKRIAERLGFEFDQEYPTYAVRDYR